MSGFDVQAAAQRIQQEFQQVGSSVPTNAVPKGESFGKVLEGMLRDTNGVQVEAEKATESMMRGEADNVHEVMLAMAKADVSFRMMLEVRNKLVDAYQEVMRMQV